MAPHPTVHFCPIVHVQIRRQPSFYQHPMDLPGLYCPAFFGAGKTRSQTLLDERPERPPQFSSPLFGGDQKLVGQFYGRFHETHNTIFMGIFPTGILGIGYSTPELHGCNLTDQGWRIWKLQHYDS
jgi:hypothetical protein